MTIMFQTIVIYKFPFLLLLIFSLLPKKYTLVDKDYEMLYFFGIHIQMYVTHKKEKTDQIKQHI